VDSPPSPCSPAGDVETYSRYHISSKPIKKPVKPVKNNLDNEIARPHLAILSVQYKEGTGKLEEK
jgi:hypothetical protein